MYSAELEKRLRWILDSIEELSLRAATAPEGKISTELQHNRLRYYQRGNGKRHYLSRKQTALIARLLQKDYDEKALAILGEEKKLLEKLLRLHSDANLENSYSCYTPEEQALVKPLFETSDAFVRRWESLEYAQKPIQSGQVSFLTAKGERVRSKSEVIIANALFGANVSYHYERPLMVEGMGVVYPDFTILNKRTREEYIWEHFGMMDDENYRRQALDKIDGYTLAGWFMGKRLLATFEGQRHPFNTRIVDYMIREHLV